MGILIRIDLAKNNKELNVKVLDDDGLPDLVDRKLNTLANLNVAVSFNLLDLTLEFFFPFPDYSILATVD